MLAQHIKLWRNFCFLFFSISLGNKNLKNRRLPLIRLTFADLNIDDDDDDDDDDEIDDDETKCRLSCATNGSVLVCCVSFTGQ